MTRIVQIVADGKPGGGTTAVLTLSTLLAARGNQVHVISQKDSYLLRQAEKMGCITYGIDFSKRFMAPFIALLIARTINRIAPAVIHAHGSRAALPIALAVRSRLLDHAACVAYTVHGFHYAAKSRLMKSLGCRVEGLCIGSADWTNFVSDGDRALAHKDGLMRKARISSTVKNAVTIDPQDDRQDKCFDIGFVGRLTGQKNPLLLREIMRALRPAKPTLAVIGGGALEAGLRHAFESDGLMPQVTMFGECSRTEALRLLSRCRVLVLPSLWEGHPITLIEAMMLGIPAVASDIAGIDEIVRHGETGYLAATQDAPAFARYVSQLLGDEVLRSRMGDDAMRIASVGYSTDHMLQEHLRHYEAASRSIAKVA